MGLIQQQPTTQDLPTSKSEHPDNLLKSVKSVKLQWLAWCRKKWNTNWQNFSRNADHILFYSFSNYYFFRWIGLFMHQTLPVVEIRLELRGTVSCIELTEDADLIGVGTPILFTTAFTTLFKVMMVSSACTTSRLYTPTTSSAILYNSTTAFWNDKNN